MTNSVAQVRPAPGGGLFLDSGLWIDQPDAPQRIAERLASGELTAEQAEALDHFVRWGYAVVPLELDERLFEQIETDVNRCWREKSPDLIYAYDGPPRWMSVADEAAHRKSKSRIHDLHSHSEAALSLYLEPRLHEIVRLILGEPAVAIQSLYFQFGSQQILHRDPVVVPTGAPGHLVAAWIALEDIHPDCGALAYVPGSHKLPYYEFRPGQYMFDGNTMGGEDIAAAFAFDEEQCRKHGLETRLFTPKRGEALIWHASLRHGGSPLLDPSLTRKSFVIHYATQASYPTRSITVFEPGPDGEEVPRICATERILERDGCCGFDNPTR